MTNFGVIGGTRAKRGLLAVCVSAALIGSATAAPYQHGNQQRLLQAAQKTAEIPQSNPLWLQTPLMAASSSPDATFGVVTPANCLDDLSAGSLRKKLETAQDNDTVDLTHLTCSTITLDTATNGELHVTQDKLKVFGPTDHRLTIDAAANGRALNVDDSVTIYDLGFKNGKVDQDDSGGPRGGCIHVSGTLTILRSDISGCTVTSDSGEGEGGGVWSHDLEMHNSRVAANSVSSPAGSGAAGGGGGIYANTATIVNSTIEGNHVDADSTAYGGAIDVYPGTLDLLNSKITGNEAQTTHSYVSGGGVYATNMTVTLSTIADNHAESNADSAWGGGIYVGRSFLGVESTIADNTTQSSSSSSTAIGGGVVSVDAGGVELVYSTVSNNKATCTQSGCSALGGGVATAGPSADTVSIINSTVSGNSVDAGDDGGGGGVYIGNNKALIAEGATIAFNQTSSTNSSSGGGVETSSPAFGASVVNNTIIAQNTMASGQLNDAGTIGGLQNVISGSNSIIPNPDSSVFMFVTNLGTSDPKLKPLAYNGGSTMTHAIDATSPAFDAGAIDDATPACDQRGFGFYRAVGANVDIGAFEANLDEIFASSFGVADPKEFCNFTLPAP
jgi:hypothetical protein